MKCKMCGEEKPLGSNYWCSDCFNEWQKCQQDSGNPEGSNER